MRLLAIGDIHGCFTALSALWEIVQPSDADVMVFLGDYVDRGPQSREVLDWLVNESAKSQRIFLRGNHEVMMLDAADNPIHADSWKSCGGLETLMSYGIARSFGWPSEIPDAHWEFLRKTARHHETAKHIFVHGCLDPRLDPDEQLDDVIYWETFDQLKPHKSRKKIVCGHTPIQSGKIVDVGYGVCIDTGVVYGGWLTCLDANSGQYWQSNQEGQTRQF